MKAKKCVMAGILATAMLCQSLAAPGLAWTGISTVQAAASNVALNKTVTVSGVETGAESCTGDLAVDGTADGTHRWSAPQMKNISGQTEQSPQWLVIDLAAAKTEVESIKITYHLKVWSTDYRIETSDSADSGWETVYSLTKEPGDSNAVVDNIAAADMDKSALKRYVRFYFNKVNQNAGGNSVSVQEIEIYGTQTGAEQTEVTTAQQALNAIGQLTISPDDTMLQIPEVSDKYEISVYGSDMAQVLDDSGRIAPLRIGDRSMNVIVKAVNKTNASDTAKKSFTVTVPDNTDAYPQMFPQAAAPNEKPAVLPTIQEWYGYEGNWTLDKGMAIIVNDAANVGLMEVAAELQADLQEICGVKLDIITGAAGDQAGIYLESQVEDIYGTGEEGYLMEIGDRRIEIRSSAKTGVLYGTVTAEQILYQDPAHRSVPCGVVRDYPDYAVRGVMMDVARIPTRFQFLEDYTKIFKWYKLNTVQIHLNDNQWSEPAYSKNYADWAEVEASHRLESELFPSLATMDSKFEKDGDHAGRFDYYYSTHTGTGRELYYTKEEYRQLEKDFAARGIKLVAELDTPGHSAAYNKYVYENQQEVITSLVKYGYLDGAEYLNADGTVKKNFYINNPKNFELLSIDEADTSNVTIDAGTQYEKVMNVGENAVNAKIFMTALFDEYLGGIEGIEPIFTADTVSAGVDEYWEKTSGTIKAFGEYINYMRDLLGTSDNVTYGKNGKGYGKEVIIWGAFSQFQVSSTVPKDLTIALWNSGYEDDPMARLREGFSLINIPQPFLYTTPGRWHKDMVNETYVYYNWEPTRFTSGIKADDGEPLLKGAMAALWGDENREGITEADLNERYLRVGAMVAEKTWGGSAENDFLAYEQTRDRLKEGPGTSIACDVDSMTNVVADYDFANVSADGKTIYDASGNGYNGTITGGKVVEQNGEKMLRFDGKTSISTPVETLGYPYTMSFDLYLDGTEQNTRDSALFSGYDGRLLVSGYDGKLGLNRDYFTQSFDYQPEAGAKHRITVVGTYQATKLYVDGVFQKILYAAASDPDNGGDIGVDTKGTTDAQNNFRTTFVFPMSTIGKDFQGYIGNIKAYNKALSTEELSAEAAGDVTEADVARNCGAYADNENTAHSSDLLRLYPAWKATDGDGHVTGATGVSNSYESKWVSSDRNGDFLMLDLGQSRRINKVVIDWASKMQASAYKIQVSGDGITWSDAASVTGNTSVMTTDTFSEVDARYVKMQGVTRTGSEYGIFEMKVYGAVDKYALQAVCDTVASELKAGGIGWENADYLYRNYVYAKAVANDVLAGQEEVDAATARLTAAKAAGKSAEAELKKLADLSQAGQYEAAGWAVYQEAYLAVKNASASVTAEELAQLVAAAKQAYTALVKKQIDKPVPEVKPVQLAAPAVKSVKSTATGVKVTWSAAANASSYQLYRKVGSKAVKVGSPVTGTSLVDKSPVGGKDASYYVIALSGNKALYLDSATGAAKSIKLPKATAKVTAKLVKGKRNVKLTWKKVSKATSYLIYRSEKKNGTYKKIATVKKKNTYTDKKVKKKKTYYYKVVTVSAKKYSPMKAAKGAVKVK